MGLVVFAARRLVDLANERREDVVDADLRLGRNLKEVRLVPIGQRLSVVRRDNPLPLKVALVPNNNDGDIVGVLRVSAVSHAKPGHGRSGRGSGQGRCRCSAR